MAFMSVYSIQFLSHLEVGACAVVHIVSVPLEVEHGLAVVAAVGLELVECLDEGADQAGPQLLHTLGHRVHRHCDLLSFLHNYQTI